MQITKLPYRQILYFILEVQLLRDYYSTAENVHRTSLQFVKEAKGAFIYIYVIIRTVTLGV